MRILFVCSGNTCRSPLAEQITLHLATYNNLPLEADSAGLATNGGDPISAQSRKVLLSLGGSAKELDTHRSKGVSLSLVQSADLVLCMSPGQATYFKNAFLSAGLTKEAEKIRSFPNAIGDPFGGEEEEYWQVAYEMTSQLVPLLLEEFSLPLLVRDGFLEDLSFLSRLETESFSSPFSLDSLTFSLCSASSAVLVAEDASGPVGFVILSGAADQGELESIAVSEGKRNKGIGRALLSASFALAAKRGWNQLNLEVRPSNLAARSLYESEGFSLVGNRPNYYDHPKEDALLYTKTIQID